MGFRRRSAVCFRSDERAGGRCGSALLQAKLAVGSVDDPLEHEADRVADQVMRMPDPAVLSHNAPLQVSRKCAQCEEEDKQKLQRKSAGATESQSAPPIVHEVLASPGAPLDSDTRAFMEPRFGYDFSRVRVHSDAAAARSAQAVNALAYTVGERIVLGGAGASPRLLAHELAHVVQQGGGAKPALRRQQKTVGGPLDLKPDPCIALGRDDKGEPRKACGSDAVSVCEQVPSLPACSVVCNTLGCNKPNQPKTPCPPNSRAATSSGFLGQCCFGSPIDTAQNCCPPGRLAGKPSLHCCAGDEAFDRITDTCIKVKDISALPVCPPERQTTFGQCCLPSQIAQGPICSFPDFPGLGAPSPRTPVPLPTLQFGTLWTDTIHFNKDRPLPGEGDSGRVLTDDGVTELDGVQTWLTNSPDLQVRLTAHASSEGEADYNQRLSERRLNFIADKVGDRLAEPIGGDLAAIAGCISRGTGKWACGESSADQSKADENDRVVRVTFMRNTLPKIEVPPVQSPPRLPPQSTPGLGE